VKPNSSINRGSADSSQRSFCYNGAVRLADKGIIVTGATGIAAASTIRLATEGARTFVVARNEGQCLALADQVLQGGGSMGWAIADLTDEGQAIAAFKAGNEALGRIDGLMAVAGGSGRGFGDGPVHETSLEGWERTLQINGTPTFLAAREAIRVMRGQDRDEDGARGSLVVISSVLAEHPAPGLFATHAYAGIKGGTASFARAMAAYYAPEGIRVNVVAPGLVRTPMSERAAADPDTVAYSKRKQPLAGGFLEPDQIADVGVFLLSSESTQITGQVIAVDGGWGVTEA
jgi:NAD(P)-dependent dehydrogenase (short-subunit alcohol dehydrogenase family)